jgi:hypothetical protein
LALGKFERGFEIERIAGGNLSKNFPVIDKVIGAEVTSIKSIDLTMKPYTSGTSSLKSVGNKYVNALASFKGRTWGGQTVTITANSIKNLELYYQTGKATQDQLNILSQIQTAAKNLGVNLFIKPIK